MAAMVVDSALHLPIALAQKFWMLFHTIQSSVSFKIISFHRDDILRHTACIIYISTFYVHIYKGPCNYSILNPNCIRWQFLKPFHQIDFVHIMLCLRLHISHACLKEFAYHYTLMDVYNLLQSSHFGACKKDVDKVHGIRFYAYKLHSLQFLKPFQRILCVHLIWRSWLN